MDVAVPPRARGHGYEVFAEGTEAEEIAVYGQNTGVVRQDMIVDALTDHLFLSLPPTTWAPDMCSNEVRDVLSSHDLQDPEIVVYIEGVHFRDWCRIQYRRGAIWGK